MNKIVEKAKADARKIFLDNEAKQIRLSITMRKALVELVSKRPVTAGVATLRGLMSRKIISEAFGGFAVNPIGYAIIDKTEYDDQPLRDFSDLIRGVLQTEYRIAFKAFRDSELIYAIDLLEERHVRRPHNFRAMIDMHRDKRQGIKAVTLIKVTDITKGD